MIARGSPSWAALAIITAAGLLGLLLALMVSVQAMLPLAALAGLGLVAAVVALNKETMLWILLLSALILGGSISYFAGIGQVQWVPIGIAAGLLVVVLLHLVAQSGRGPATPIPAGLVLASTFALAIVVSTAWEAVSLPHWIYGLRYFAGMSVIMFALALLPWRDDTLRKIWIALTIIALLQFPVALYQYMVVAGQRVELGADGVPWDAVVGTMGGKQDGGGQSAALGFFSVAMFVLVFTLWKRGLLSVWRALGFGGVVLGVIFLAEVKAMVIIMPLAVMLVLRADLARHIKQVLAGGVLIALLALAMPWFYNKLHYERSGQPTVSLEEFYGRIIEHSDTSHFNRGTQQLGRVAQVVHWWDRHDLSSDPKRFLLGHGMGTTNAARVYAGDLVRQYYPLSVTNTAGGILLWETGVVGMALVLAAVLSTALLSLRLSKQQDLPPFHRAALEAGAVILLILIPALFYKHFALKSHGAQFVIFFAAGQAFYWRAELARRLQQPVGGGLPGRKWVVRRLL